MIKKLNIRKGDRVKVIAGVSKGVEAKVIKVLPKTSRVNLEGDNIRKNKRHTKPNQIHQDGGIINIDASIHISNVMLVDPTTGEATRVGRRQVDNKSVRYSKKSGEVIK